MNDSTPLRFEHAARGLDELRVAALAGEREFARELADVPALMRESARNLVHWLGVRRPEARGLCDELGRLGLGSLERAQPHVLASLQAVLVSLHALRGDAVPDEVAQMPVIPFDLGRALIAARAERILGPAHDSGRPRIMATVPGEAAEDPALIVDLLDAGMEIMRIDCASDGIEAWRQMLMHLRRVEGGAPPRRCAVLFDLAGPGLRTGPIEPGPAVAKWRPVRNAIGRVTQLARVRFVGRMHEADGDDAIPVKGDLLVRARPGDAIELRDARGRARALRVVEADGAGECVCETDSTAYVVPGTRLALRRGKRVVTRAAVGALPTLERWISLTPGDRLDLVLGDRPGRDAVHDDDGRLVQRAFVSCALPEVFRAVRAGEPILIDDGRIRGRIVEIEDERLGIEIAQVARGAAKLRAGKGLNLPETGLDLPALTAKDVEDLAFAAGNADMVAPSFVQHPEDIDRLHAALARIDAPPPGIVLKIETRAAFERLPALLLAAMRHPPIAVMVARAELGVEVGFERLAEVQEEIAGLSRAAHAPLICAVHVPESLAKGGMPSRADVADAALCSHADCVMLQEGPYVRETLRFLADVLHRMDRPVTSAKRFVPIVTA